MTDDAAASVTQRTSVVHFAGYRIAAGRGEHLSPLQDSAERVAARTRVVHFAEHRAGVSAREGRAVDARRARTPDDLLERVGERGDGSVGRRLLRTDTRSHRLDR